MSNYLTMANRYRACTTIYELWAASLSFDRIYNAGIFTESEAMRLEEVWAAQSLLLER